MTFPLVNAALGCERQHKPLHKCTSQLHTLCAAADANLRDLIAQREDLPRLWHASTRTVDAVMKPVARLQKSATLKACWVLRGSNRFTQYILFAMALGILMGALIFNYLPDIKNDLAADIILIAMLFLRLIKMIIARLVFATLVGGIAHMGSGARLGRIFAKTMGWFVSASFVSLLLGLLMVNLLQPGANFPGTLPDKAASTGLPVSAFSIEKFLTHLIPTSIADAMAQNEILQIVVFAVFFSVALGAAPERSKPILSLIDDLGHIMLHPICRLARRGRGTITATENEKTSVMCITSGFQFVR
jgi:hypothetical protein